MLSGITAAAVLAGCGGGSSPRAASGTTGRSVPGGAAVLLSALDRTMTLRTARFEMHISIEGLSAGADIDANGVVDLSKGSADMTATVHADGRSETADARVVDGTVYAKVNGEWVSRPESAASTTSGTSDPTAFVDELRGITDDLRQTGSGSSHGDPTTEYAATIDLRKLSERPGVDPARREKAESAISALGLSTLPVRVQVDGENRLRKLDMTFDLSHAASIFNSAAAGERPTMKLSMELWDFGVPVDIKAPAGATAG